MRAPPSQKPTKDSIVVLASGLDDESSEELVASNVAFVNMLFGEYLEREEIPKDALRSYDVDYFLAEFENGGFSQFVYNTRWDKDIVTNIREGLKAMGAKRHLKAFEKGAKLVEAVSKEKLEAYCNGGYFHQEGEQDEEEEEDPVDWDVVDEALSKAGDAEDLFDLHVTWLRKNPLLFPMQTEEEMQEEARRRGAALPDQALRKAKALASEPRHLKLMRALCKEAGQEFEEWIGTSRAHEFEGELVDAFNFMTNEGRHRMIEREGRAFMFEMDSMNEVCSIVAPPDEVLH